MTSFLDVCRFNPTAGGTTDWTVSTNVQGYQTPASANAVNGATYRYRAESSDLSQWEVGYGTYNTSTAVLTRSTVLFNSAGTTAKINFSAAPQVGIVALAEDLLYPRGYIDGLTLSTAGSSATFTVAAGQALDGTNADVMTLSASLSKTTSAWAVGSGNGGLDTGSIANSTWYHSYLIKRVDTGVVDALVSLSASSPTLPTGYTLSRRIGSMKTNGSAQWTAFIQTGDNFRWSTPVRDVTATNPGTAAVLATLTVPTGIVVEADIAALVAALTNASIYALITSPSETDNAPAGASLFTIGIAGSATGNQVGLPVAHVFTNTSAQVRYRLSASGASDTFVINTFGWIDRRGKNS